MHKTIRLGSLALTLTLAACGQQSMETPKPAGAFTLQGIDGTDLVSGDIYRLINTNSNLALDVSEVSQSSGANVHIWAVNNQANQSWKIEDVGNGLATLKAQHSGLCLDVKSSDIVKGTNVQQYACDGSNAQKFKPVALGNGVYKLLSAVNNGLALDVAGGGTANGTNVQLWIDNGSGAQTWKLERLDASSGGGTGGSTPSTVRTTYEASGDSFPNPERGWYYIQQPINSKTLPLSGLDFAGLRAQNITLVRQNYLLNAWRTQALPQSFLDTVQKDFDTVRQQGFKLIPVFSYNWVHSQTGNQDTSASWMSQHLDQLKPLFAKNQDVFAFLDNGFVGYWGEWHDSTSGLIEPGTLNITDEGKKVFAKVIDSLPAQRLWAARYTEQIMQVYPTALSQTGAYGTSPQARVGLSNLGIRSDKCDWGSWSCWNPDLEAQQKEYAEQATQFTVQSGEPGGVNDQPESREHAVDREGALNDWQRFHYSTIAMNQTDAERTGQYDGWKQNGTYAEADKRLGYRFRLLESSFPGELKPGGEFKLSLNITNDGWAAPFNPRKFEVILRHASNGRKVRLTLTDDLRWWQWQPGTGRPGAFEVTGGLPRDLSSGTYDVLLSFPDPAPALYERPEYSIRLANNNVWEEDTGYNKLGGTLRVTSDAGGNDYTGSDWFR